MSTIRTTYDDPALRRARRSSVTSACAARPGDGLCRRDLGFAALGAYLGRDLSGGAGLVLFILAFACIFGLNIAAASGREQLAIGLLFGLGSCSAWRWPGPRRLRQGRARRRCGRPPGDGDVRRARWARPATPRSATCRRGRAPLFWALLALIVFGIVAIFVSIPNANVIYAVAGPRDLRRFTIFDFNRLRRASGRRRSDRRQHLPRRLQRLPVLPRCSAAQGTDDMSLCPAHPQSLAALDRAAGWLNSEPLTAAGCAGPSLHRLLDLRLRHLARIREPLLAGRLPRRLRRARPLPALRRGRLRGDRTGDPAIARPRRGSRPRRHRRPRRARRLGHAAISGDVSRFQPRRARPPGAEASALALNQWALGGEWSVRDEVAVLEAPGGAIAYRFHARDLNLVLEPPVSGAPVRFVVRLDGQPPGAARGLDVDETGEGTVTEPRMYQLIRQPDAIAPRTFEITFLDPGARAYVFTFG